MLKSAKKIKKINGAAFDSVLLAIIQIVTYATNIFTTKILAVELSLREFGTYATVNSVITIAASLTLFGLGDTINYFYNRQIAKNNNQEREEYVNTVFLIQLLVGVGVGCILIVFSGNISLYYRNTLIKPLLIIVCLKPWISNATHLYQVLFVSSGKAKLIAIRNLIISVLKIILLYGSIKLFRSISAIFICLVFLDLFQLVFFKVIFGKIRFNVNVFHYKKDKVMPVIKYAVPMGIYFVTTTLMREIDKLVVGGFGQTEDLAIYSNCAKTLPLNFLVVSFATVLVPYIMKYVSSRKYEDTTKIITKYLKVGYMSVWMLSSAILLCSTEVIQFFYSKEYLIGLPIFVIYIIDGMVQFASVHLVIAANGNSNYLMKVSVILMIVNAGMSVGLYKIFEIFNFALLGPAVTTLIISIIYVYILLRKSAIIMGTNIRKFLPIRHMFNFIVEMFVVGVIFYLLKQFMYKINIHWFIRMLIVSGGFCSVICLTRLKEFKQLFLEINQLKNME